MIKVSISINFNVVLSDLSYHASNNSNTSWDEIQETWCMQSKNSKLQTICEVKETMLDCEEFVAFFLKGNRVQCLLARISPIIKQIVIILVY